jgi:acyl-coenzyme A thioesterase PaaI-like protein
LRELACALLSTGATPRVMDEVAAQLRAQRQILSSLSDGSTESQDPASIVPGMQDFFDRGPICGRANPIAPPATLAPDLDAQVVRGEVTFGPQFEGAPGCVHGGFVAALLDEALGMATIFTGGPGMTGQLTTRFLQHTPVATPLRVEARLDSVDGRKLSMSGELYHGEVAVAEASGIFISVKGSKFQDLLDAKSDAEG